MNLAYGHLIFWSFQKEYPNHSKDGALYWMLSLAVMRARAGSFCDKSHLRCFFSSQYRLVSRFPLSPYCFGPSDPDDQEFPLADAAVAVLRQ